MKRPVISFGEIGSLNIKVLMIIGIIVPSIKKTSSIIYAPFLTEISHDTTNNDVDIPGKSEMKSTSFVILSDAISP